MLGGPDSGHMLDTPAVQHLLSSSVLFAARFDVDFLLLLGVVVVCGCSVCLFLDNVV